MTRLIDRWCAGGSIVGAVAPPEVSESTATALLDDEDADPDRPEDSVGVPTTRRNRRVAP